MIRRVWRYRLPTEVWIETTELRQMQSIAKSRMPNETGGILVGARSSRGLWVLTAIEVPNQQPRPSGYSLATIEANRTLNAFLRHARLDKGKFGYIGTWHSHPAPFGPSSIDYSTVRRDSRCQGDTVAMLVIAPCGASRWTTHAVIASKQRTAEARVTRLPRE
jgi:proteasome lid subunit RPN8/RPN11